LGLSLKADGERTTCVSGIERLDVAAYLNDPEPRIAGLVGRVPISKDCSSVQLTGIVDGRPEIPADIAVPRTPEQHAGGCEPPLFWLEQEVLAPMRGLRTTPEISIPLPAYNTHRYYIERCLGSVLRQHASNAALRLATDEQIVLLDHDDELHPSALLEVVRCCSPEADLIYSDEDKIDTGERRFAPAFRPSVNPEINIGFQLYRTSGLFWPDVAGTIGEGAAGLRWVPGLGFASPGQRRDSAGPRSVYSQTLYHWHSHPDSTAMGLSAKPHVHQAWRRVLCDHAQRTGKPADVREGLFAGSMHLRFNDNPTSVAAVYRTSDGAHQRSAIQRTGCSNLKLYELTLSQSYPRDAASPGSLLVLSQLQGDVLTFLNAAVESLNQGFFDELVSCAAFSGCGIASALIVDTDNRIVNAGLDCRLDGTLINSFIEWNYVALGYMGLAKVPRAVAGIGAECFAVRTSRLQFAGGLAALSEETLTSVRSRLVQSAHAEGVRVLYTPSAVMTIRLGATEEERSGHVASFPGSLLINPNIDAFSSPTDSLQRGDAQ
jgi:hypothetical protein